MLELPVVLKKLPFVIPDIRNVSKKGDQAFLSLDALISDYPGPQGCKVPTLMCAYTQEAYFPMRLYIIPPNVGWRSPGMTGESSRIRVLRCGFMLHKVEESG